MSNSSTILHKKNYVSGVVPTFTSLSSGEIAINVYDGKLFIKTTDDTIKSFSNDSNLPFILDISLSGVNTQYGNNTISEVFANVLGGYNNDVTGGGSTVINGENNDIDSDFSTILNGLDNKISFNSDYSVILGGKNNLINHENVFTLGSHLSSHANNFTYVNNISAQGYFYGDGSNLTGVIAAGVIGPDSEVRALTANWESTYTTVQSESASWVGGGSEYLPLSGGALTGTILGDLSATGSFYGDGSKLTGIVAGDTVATTLVRSNSANWDSVYTSYNANSASIDASYITSGTLSPARLPTFNGDITANTSNGSVSATVVAIQGSPISVQNPNNGQTLQWNGTAWTPGAIPNGGSGGGGLVYYLNFANEAQTPTTNLSVTPNTPKELGITGIVGASSYTLNNVSTTTYDLICGFVSLTASPNTTVIPAGLWDFNIWASATSNVTSQMILKLDVYKYDGSNIPTLLASSGDIYIYDPVATAQYIASVVFPQTTLLTTDRIYIELRAKGTQNNKNVTIYFGGATPTHVHTTFPSVGGSGLVKTVNGVYQSPASLLVNTDVAANAAIDQSKINGLTDVADKANTTYTTVQTNSATAWNYQGTDLKSLSSGWVGGNSAFTTVQSNSANWKNTLTPVDYNYSDIIVSPYSIVLKREGLVNGKPYYKTYYSGNDGPELIEVYWFPSGPCWVFNWIQDIGSEQHTATGNTNYPWQATWNGDGIGFTVLLKESDLQAQPLQITSSYGSSISAARADHVHPYPTALQVSAVSLTEFKSLSSNWQSSYTTVNSNSANWQTTFTASPAYVSSNPTGITGASALTKLLQITQAGYNALTPASDTLYIIVG